MKEEQFKQSLDKAERMGFDRGVATIVKAILETIEKSGGTAISYKSIKDIYDEFKKQCLMDVINELK